MKWKILYNCQCPPSGHEMVTLTTDAETEEEAMKNFQEEKKDMYPGYFCGKPEKAG